MCFPIEWREPNLVPELRQQAFRDDSEARRSSMRGTAAQTFSSLTVPDFLSAHGVNLSLTYHRTFFVTMPPPSGDAFT
jgi:hypothetical protein